jgi:hypothetical protein
MFGTRGMYYVLCWVAFFGVLVSSHGVHTIASLKDITQVMNARLATEQQSVRHQALRKKFVDKVMRTNVIKNTDGTGVDDLKRVNIQIQDITSQYISRIADR